GRVSCRSGGHRRSRRNARLSFAETARSPDQCGCGRGPEVHNWRKPVGRGRTAMSMSACVRGGLATALVVWIAIEGGRAQTQDVPPVNSGANPYRVIRDWAQLTLEGRPWGGSNGVAIDKDGRSVWATDRCSQGIAPGCLGTKANPVHLFDPSGKEVRS